MGELHLQSITPKDLERAGVSRREFDVIKKLMKLDKEIFRDRTYMTKTESPYVYKVDLSKYDQDKVPQDCKEILYRPQKMRKIHERYWQLASFYDKKQKEKDSEIARRRFHPRKLNKFDDELLLTDRIISTIDTYLQEQEKIKQHEAKKHAEAISTGEFRNQMR